MAVPKWMTSQCWAFAFGLLATIFLIVAMAMPWYNIVYRHGYLVALPDGIHEGFGNAVIALYWHGETALWKDDGVSRTNHHNVGWGDLGVSDPKDYYLGSMALIVMTFIFTVVVLLPSIMFCLMMKGLRHKVDMKLRGWSKWIIVGFGLFAFLLCLLSWIVLFGITDAFDKAHFNACPSGKYWCGSFAGKASEEMLVGGEEMTMYWAPSLGWVFAILANGTLLVVVILVALVRKAGDYTLVINRDL